MVCVCEYLHVFTHIHTPQCVLSHTTVNSVSSKHTHTFNTISLYNTQRKLNCCFAHLNMYNSKGHLFVSSSKSVTRNFPLILSSSSQSWGGGEQERPTKTLVTWPEIWILQISGNCFLLFTELNVLYANKTVAMEFMSWWASTCFSLNFFTFWWICTMKRHAALAASSSCLHCNYGDYEAWLVSYFCLWKMFLWGSITIVTG